jgi:hypothetical protein
METLYRKTQNRNPEVSQKKFDKNKINSIFIHELITNISIIPMNRQSSIEIKDTSVFDNFLSQYNLSISSETIKKVHWSLTLLFSRNTYMNSELGWEKRHVASERVDAFLRRAMDILETSPQEHLWWISYREAQNKFSIHKSGPYLGWRETIEPITQDELNNTLEAIIEENTATKNRLNDIVAQMASHDLS